MERWFRNRFVFRLVVPALLASFASVGTAAYGEVVIASTDFESNSVISAPLFGTAGSMQTDAGLVFDDPTPGQAGWTVTLAGEGSPDADTTGVVSAGSGTTFTAANFGLGNSQAFQFNDSDGVDTLSFAPVDVSGFTDINFSFDWATVGGDVFEPSDSFTITANGTNIFAVPGLTPDLNTGPFVGSLVGPTLDLTAAGVDLSSGSLAIDVSVFTDDDNESILFDNFEIRGTAVPEPGSALLVGSLALGCWTHRRRRRANRNAGQF